MSGSIPVFLCYRQADGLTFAKAVFALLDGETLPDGNILELYWDRNAPAVVDWRKIHLPYLKSAHAMVFIATPGSCARIAEGRLGPYGT